MADVDISDLPPPPALAPPGSATDPGAANDVGSTAPDISDLPAPQPVQQTTGGAAQAAGSGVGSFALDTAGLPVATVRNVEELGKAALGAAGSVLHSDTTAPGETMDESGNFAVTKGGLYHWRTVDGTDIYSKKPPPANTFTYGPVVRGGGYSVPKWLQPEDPDAYKYDIGSPDFLKQQLRNLGGTNLVDVQQQTRLNRYLNAGVEGALSATIGGEANVPAVAKALAVGGTVGAVSQQASESGADPALANAAGLLTGALMHRTLTPKAVEAPPVIPKATVDPAERILQTPALPGPSPAEVDGKTPAAPAAVQEPAAPEATPASSPTTNNASGESSASAEAISRVAQEKAAGQTRHVIDEDGRASPLVGVDAADAVARPGTIIVQKGVGAEPVTILDRGGLPLAQAHGLLARAQANGELDTRPPLRQGATDPADDIYDAQVRQDMDAAATNPTGARPPLRQGSDAAGPLIDQHVREQMGVVEHQPATAQEPYVDPGSTHPMRNGQPYAMVSAERPDATPQENAQRTQLLGQVLQASGMRSAPTQGSYQGVTEHSYAVQTPSPKASDFVNKVAAQFKQDSVMHVDENQNATMHYGDGRQEWLGGMKQVPASEAQALPGWTRDTQGNFYTVKPPGSQGAPAETATASQSIFGDPAKTGGASNVLPIEQAKRAATFKRLGLDEVRQSAVTGNAKEAVSDRLTSKLGNSAGVRMAQLQDTERGVLMGQADKLVSESGGSKGLSQPDLESRGRKMAAPIEGYDQALEQATQRIYDVAKTIAAGKPIQLGGLTHMMTKQKSEFLGTVEGKQLLEGVQARMQELGFMGDNDTFHPATVEQAERLRQYIGQQYNHRVKPLISLLKNHLDNDVAATAGADIFKQAREVRALRAKVLEEPEGVSRLLQPKEANKLGINRITEFTDIPHMITQLEPDQFGHYIDTLRVIATASPELRTKALAALRETRSQYANEVQAEGNKTAGAWNQKAVNQYLKKNELNMRKVFTSEELGQYQDLDNAGRWLHQDQSYPGAAATIEHLLTNTVLKGGGKLAEGVGAIAGHVPGWIAGKGIDALAGKAADKIMSKTIEGRITKLNKNAKGGGVRADQPVAGAGAIDAMSGLAPNAAPGGGGDQGDFRGVGHLGDIAPGQRGGPKAPRPLKPLSGMPDTAQFGGFTYHFGPSAPAREAAQAYAKSAGIKYKPVEWFRQLDPKNGKEIADAYDAMKDDPTDPKVAASYAALIRETKAQYRAIERTGLKIQFIPPGMTDPYATSPRLAIIDANQNNHLWVFPTDSGFGVLNEAQAKHPLLADSGIMLDGKMLKNNDLFRVVHDYFGHIAEGNGFRAQGEYNAWRIHSRMFSPEAQGALASETLGQNAWVNFGPHAKANEGASGANTVYADQKTGLMDPSVYGGPKGSLVPEHDTAAHPDSISMSQSSAIMRAKLSDQDKHAVDFIVAQMHDRGGQAGKQIFDHLAQKGKWTPERTQAVKDVAQSQYWGELMDKTNTPEPDPEPDPPPSPPPLALSFPKQRGGPKFEAPSSITKYLTEPEKAQLRTDTAQRLVEAFHALPHTNELAAAALAGRAKRGWYDQSAKAITNVFGPDAPRFTALLAAMSPQTSVQMNFHNALRSFIGWDKAGRPTDPAAIRKIMEDNSLKSPKARPEGSSNVMDAWFNNSVRALTDADPEKLTLSGPKVDSFMKNLMGHVNAVTLDAWMSSFARIDPGSLAGKLNQSGPGKSPMYLAYSAKVREAAQKLSKLTGDKWTPAEIQETVWSWAKTAYEHAEDFGSMATIPELVKNGEVTDELIKSTPAFHDLFSEAGHSASLRDSSFSGGLERLHEGTGSHPGEGASSEKADAAARSLKPHLYKAAERLEGVRQERTAAKRSIKSPLLGDDTTEF